MADEGDHDALDDEFLGGDEVWVVGVFGFQVGLPIFDEVALEGGFTVDEGRDDVSRTGLANFEDHEVTAEDVGIDHRISAHLQSEGLGVSGDAEGLDVDRNAAVELLLLIRGEAGGDPSVNGDIDDLGSVTVTGKDDGSRETCMPLNGTLFFQSPEMAHRGGLAGEAKVLLDVACGRHDAMFTLVAAEKLQHLALAVSQDEVAGIRKHRGLNVRVNSPCRDALCKWFPFVVKWA